MHVRQVPLSQSATAREWLNRFSSADQLAATTLIDSLLLLNDEDIAAAVHGQLSTLASMRKGFRAKTALYVEREYPRAMFFDSPRALAKDGKVRRRAGGQRGPPAVMPSRGGVRVGSEGSIASLVSQAVEAHPKLYLNHPEPDRFRSNKVGLIVIVTDFIGTGGRVCGVLNKLMATPSVRSWRSNRWIEFAIVAAAATRDGIDKVKAHRVHPLCFVTHIVPTLQTFAKKEQVEGWMQLFKRYGPRKARGAGPTGYKENGALVAFSYRCPNNTPLILHASEGGWVPLFRGPITTDMRSAFGLKPLPQRLVEGLIKDQAVVADDLSDKEGKTLLVLNAIRGRWRKGQELALAELTGLTVPEVLDIKERALSLALLTPEGRLSDLGQNLAHAGKKKERRRPELSTRAEPYYPLALRAPR